MFNFFLLPLFLSLTVFCLNHKHFLLSLLSLEFLTTVIYFLLFLSLGQSFFYFLLVFISFSACEAALGLSVLINMSRSYGSDFTFLFSSSL